MLRLKQVLVAKGISTKSCADLLGVSEKTMYNKIVGASEFSYGEAQKLRTALPEYNIDYLLGEDCLVDHVFSEGMTFKAGQQATTTDPHPAL